MAIDIDKLKKVLPKIIDECIDDVFYDLAEDLEAVFFSAFMKYYTYTPKVYIRHGHSKPSSGGYNLYKSIYTDIIVTGSRHRLTIELDSSLMEGYDPSYLWYDGHPNLIHNNVTTQEVLDLITSGHRFNLKKEWRFKAKSDYFHFTGKTLDEIIDEIEQSGGKIASDLIVNRALQRLSKEDIYA